MDVVEAIDTWIDEEIDELSDDELEAILEILDVVSASEFADLETNQIYDEDIDELVDLAGGSEDDRSFTYRVLQAGIYGDSFATTADSSEEPDEAEGAQEDRDAPDSLAPDAPALEPDTPEDFETNASADEDLPLVAVGGGNDADLADTGLEDSDLDDIDHSNFLSDLAATDATNPWPALDTNPIKSLSSVQAHTAVVSSVDLREGDALGPSFLDPPGPPPKRRSSALRQYALAVFMLVGLGAFGYGMLQLINSLDAGEPEVASTLETATSEPASEEAAAAPEPTATPEPTLAPGAPTPTPTPEPTPPPRIGLRLTSGDVMLASFDTDGGPPTFDLVYDSTDDDLSAAVEVAWLDDLIGIIDDGGDILVVDPDARRPRPKLIYEAGGGLGEAVALASSRTRVAVLTNDGDITLIPSDERADPDIIEFAWDASEEDASATSLTSVDDLVPFVLENGNALMVVASDDDRLASIWSAQDQPPAANTSASRSGILLGVGQGAVARYELGPRESGAPRLVTVWDPFEVEDIPAIGYSSAGSRTAVVLADGAIVMADDTGTGEKIWDPTETELRAISVAGSETQLVVLLETGSIVIVPLAEDGVIESIWDITDETLSAAAQVTVEVLGE